MGRRGLGRLALDVRASRFPGALRMHYLAHHHGRNRVFEDQLLLVIRLEDDGILIERSNAARQLYPAQQINGNERLVFTSGVQKRILDVLRRLIVHRRSPLVRASSPRPLLTRPTGPGQYDTVLPPSFQPLLPFSPVLYNPARFSPQSAAARKFATWGLGFDPRVCPGAVREDQHHASSGRQYQRHDAAALDPLPCRDHLDWAALLLQPAERPIDEAVRRGDQGQGGSRP